jgi:hypothetical protein
VLLPIPARSVRVAAIEERGLLVRIGDVGAHLGEEVQRIEWSRSISYQNNFSTPLNQILYKRS